MIGSDAVNRLLIALVGAAFAIIGVADHKGRSPHALLFGIVGGVPLAVWAIWPTIFEVAAVGATAWIRRAGLLAGSAALLIRYQSARARHKDHRERDSQWSVGWRYAALVLLLTAVALGSANWMVTFAFAISVGAAILTVVAASRRESGEPRPGPPGN